MQQTDRARDQDDRAAHGAVVGAFHPRHYDVVHPHRCGAITAAHRAWHATAPPSAVALFLPAFVMDPALQKAYDTLVKPLGEGI